MFFQKSFPIKSLFVQQDIKCFTCGKSEKKSIRESRIENEKEGGNVYLRKQQKRPRRQVRGKVAAADKFDDQKFETDQQNTETCGNAPIPFAIQR